MAQGGRRGRVARAKLIPPAPELFRTRDEQLQSAFAPGTAVTRYGRTWLMGKAVLADNVLLGRIGFESEGGVAAVWDGERQDFAEVAIPAGVTAPFALRLSDLVIVFQTRGSVIKVNSFIGALQALLREATGDEWLLETTHTKQPFSQWRASVDRVTRMRFRLERPNPNYIGRPFVEQVIETSASTDGKIELHNEDGLVSDSEIVGQLVDHVERGYGEGTFTGVRDSGDGEKITVYSTRLEGESELTETEADEHGDVPSEVLRGELDDEG